MNNLVKSFKIYPEMTKAELGKFEATKALNYFYEEGFHHLLEILEDQDQCHILIFSAQDKKFIHIETDKKIAKICSRYYENAHFILSRNMRTSKQKILNDSENLSQDLNILLSQDKTLNQETNQTLLMLCEIKRISTILEEILTYQDINFLNSKKLLKIEEIIKSLNEESFNFIKNQKNLEKVLNLINSKLELIKFKSKNKETIEKYNSVRQSVTGFKIRALGFNIDLRDIKADKKENLKGNNLTTYLNSLVLEIKSSIEIIKKLNSKDKIDTKIKELKQTNIFSRPIEGIDGIFCYFYNSKKEIIPIITKEINKNFMKNYLFSKSRKQLKTL